eukprot:TRINITY_DN927_c0_g1::TRINITY_DN927_c0_g1_i1::g.16073::m.16073 TRINITY_DN927_c0_g1::TRINITY_DN927_c0_g1_i1::g.16073  ORF type:complete len:379 (+),score=120.58,sp/Q6ZIX2/SMT1_ORYSJ/46.60/7e-94,Sterol_MT_C/PF08498.5/1.6e-22,Methyltransf_31/PF13847.1/7.4e-13,Methyltransf_23/PF13489.1/7.9e-12,CMAS/PF02353.15/2.4e-11,Methyltransf_11/PF08241.7/1.5e-09,Methyltransf_11/PF08241.7/9.5e+03,Methyltransf_11/PF08241.7/2.6e+03,Methyltransf_12/PF08242.7/4e+03,Methyltransf_12/PF08242.7/2.3e-08,Methyltransf_12/PF
MAAKAVLAPKIGDEPGSVLSVNQNLSESYTATAAKYTSYYVEGESTGVERRKEHAPTLTDHYYDLVTDFYEYGWGQSFHFAPRTFGESFHESLRRHEYYLALRLGLKPGDRVIDCGCGVSGPLRNIANFSGAHITGLSINQAQIDKGNAKIAKAGLSKTCRAVQGNFMEDLVEQLQKVDGDKFEKFDFAFQIEATCHAGDKVKAYRNIFNALKPGGRFAGYEWIVTPKYDPKNPEHFRIVRKIEEGDALPELATAEEVVQAMKDAGFIVEDARDLALTTQIPWEAPLSGEDGYLSAFRASSTGRKVTHLFCTVTEAVGLSPKGTVDIHRLLCEAADALVEGGKLGIFTPMFFHMGRKPENAKN